MRRLLFAFVAACWLTGLGLFLVFVTAIVRVTVIIRYGLDWWLFAVGPLQ